MIKEINEILSKTYDNPVLRRTTVPLLISLQGAGKTQTVNEFARQRGVRIHTMILSQLLPMEVAGTTMPDIKSKKMIICDSELLLSLKDGEILFIDECLTAMKQTLDSFLNILEDRRLPSGKKLADFMIIAASNPQNIPNLSPAIKERFIRYDLKFNEEEYQTYMKNKFGMPETISKHLCTLITKEKFDHDSWNYMTPRSLEKSIYQIGNELSSPYDDILLPYLSEKFTLPKDNKTLNYTAGEEIEYLKILKEIVKRLD
jgi:AAA domain (dynein-related subfamily)